MNTCTFEKCFICYETNIGASTSEKCEAPSSPINSEDTGTEEKAIRKQLMTIFLLKKLFIIPEETCCQFLSQYGNPSSWVYWCDSCSVLVDEAKILFDQLKKLELRIDRLKETLKNKITWSDKRENDSRQSKILASAKNEPAEIVRTLIIQDILCEEMKSSEVGHVNVKTENVTEEILGIPSEYSMNNYCGSNGAVEHFYEKNDNDSLGDPFHDSITPETHFGNREIKKEEVPAATEKISAESEEAGGAMSHKCSRVFYEVKEKGAESEDPSSDESSDDCDAELKNEDKEDLKIPEKRFLCSLCPKRYRKNVELQHHLLTHRDPEGRPFKCSTCGKGFVQQRSLRRHENRHREDNPFRCTICNKNLTASQSLASHHLQFHSESGQVKERPHLCTSCGKSYPSLMSLKRHEKYHQEGKGYICKFCTKIFTGKSDLAQHERIHTGERPFACPTCDERFQHRGLLKKHKRIHTGEPAPYPCSVCEKRFESKSNLKAHQVVHTGEKPWTCSICGVAFSGARAGLRHIKMVHDKVPGKYPCTLCEKRFHGGLDLERHQKTHKENYL